VKIIKLEASNVKALKAVEIDADGRPCVIVAGRNGQGKSSLLDAISYALAGKRAQPARPVRDGEDRAEIVVDLDDIVVTRTIQAGGNSYLKIVSKDGGQMRSPQQLLDKLCGELTFDPLGFARAPAREQAETLRRMTGLDLSGLDSRRQGLVSARTDAQRDAKRLIAEAAEVQHYPEAPDAPLDAEELLAELERRRAHNEGAAAARRVVQDLDVDRRRLATEIAELEEDLEQLEKRIAELIRIRTEQTENVARAEAEAAQWKHADEDEVKEQLRSVSEVNRRVEANTRRQAAKDRARTAQDRARSLDEKVKTIDEEKRQALEAVEMPVKGLAFDSDGVSFNGIPFEQCSQAEQLKVSVALGLAMNPDIRVLLIRDGALLDEDSLAMVARMAEKRDAQVWVERVGSGDPAAVVIEAGEVAR
jgi:DNA repair exonuclease SbcCD ATPase subunit